MDNNTTVHNETISFLELLKNYLQKNLYISIGN